MTAEVPSAPLPEPREIRTRFYWLILLIVLGSLAAVPLLVLGHGFLPPDDALRYGAKAVSGKAWNEIMVIRPEITIDHNPGWNWFLRKVFLLTSWDARMLVQFSVLLMFLAATVPVLPWFKRPESWLLTVVVVWLVFPYNAERFFVGRPLLLTVGITLALLCLWTNPNSPKISRSRLIGSTLLFALSTWVHGSWYLFPLIPGVFLLAGDWRKAIALGCCSVVGVLAGALLTGEPIAFITQSLSIPFSAFGNNIHPRALVGEFKPFTGTWPALAIAAGMVVLRHLAGRPMLEFHKDPILLLAIVGALASAKVYRFWLDWGAPAFMLWVAFQFQDLIEHKFPAQSFLRVFGAVIAAVILCFGIGGDSNSKWSHYGKFEALDANRPEHAGWVPEKGGVLYALNLSVFYETFFQNPNADWKYALGFESTFMLPENFAVYNELWTTLDATKALTPWINKMTKADRLVLLGGPQIRPAFPQLEWNYTVKNTWVGRLPR